MTKMKSILLGTSFTLGLLAIPGGIAFAGEDQATTQGATITTPTKVEVVVPLTADNYNLVTEGTYVYIGDKNAQINPGDLSIDTSAYVSVVTPENFDLSGGSEYIIDNTHCHWGSGHVVTGWDDAHSYKFPVHVEKKADSFDWCTYGILYSTNGNTWQYSCNNSGVQDLGVQAFIVEEIDAEATITLKVPEITLSKDQEDIVIDKDDIESVVIKYEYGNKEKTYTFDENNNTDVFKVSDGVITNGKSTITIGYGIAGEVEVVVPVTYEVSYDLLGGKWPAGENASQFIPYGETATVPNVIPVREGFKFDGWSTTPGGEVIDLTKTQITGLTTLYPVWSEGAATKDAEVINAEGKEALVTAAGINNDAKELTNNLLTEEEKALLRQGQDSNIFLTVEDIKDTVSEEQMTQIKSIMEEDAVLGVVLDLNLYKQIGQNNPVQITNTEGNMVSITIAVDEKLINLDDTIQRDYYIIRVHDGEVTKIPVVFDPVAKTITFETDKFSLYALSYVDSAVPAVTTVPTVEAPPQTGDPIMTFIMMAALASGAAAVAVVLRKRATTNE